MDKTKDDLEAVRQVVAALESFTNDERERIIRWASEKLGMQPMSKQPATTVSTSIHRAPDAVGGAETSDLRSFVEKKNPQSDRHFATTIAYYYKFEAPIDHRKESITKDDLVQAVRVVNRGRLTNPGQTLINTYNAGLLDKSGRGAYKLNMVGENLVAVLLPDGGVPATTPLPKKRSTKAKKSTAKPLQKKRKRS